MTPLIIMAATQRIEATERALSLVAPRQAQVVELRYFGGLSVEETVEVMKLRDGADKP